MSVGGQSIILLSFFLIAIYSKFSSLSIYHENSQTRNLPSLVIWISKALNRYRQATGSVKIVNVDHFGAKADGIDDSQAFKKAGNEAGRSPPLHQLPFQDSAVQVSNIVIYRNIVGTNSSEVGVTFNSSKNKEFCCIALLCTAKKPVPKLPAIMETSLRNALDVASWSLNH